MEGKKKGSKEMLEEKQMKRYFRSMKRAKGKNRKENKKIEEIKPVNVVTNATVKDKSEIKEITQKSRQTSSEIKNTPKEPINQPKVEKESVKEDLSDDLADWEIVQYPKEMKTSSKNVNNLKTESKNEKHLAKANQDDIGDKPDESIDQNKLWVEEMNKVNEKISKQMKKTEETICDKDINKGTLVEQEIEIIDSNKTDLTNTCVDKDVNITVQKDPKMKDQNSESPKKEQIQEKTDLTNACVDKTNNIAVQKDLNMKDQNSESPKKEQTEDKTDLTNACVDKDINIAVHKDEKRKNPNSESPKKEQTQEFSPIVYWRDPFPEITPLQLENIIEKTVKEKKVKNDGPKQVKSKDMETNKAFNSLSHKDKGNEKKCQNKKLERKCDQNSFVSDPHCLENVWLDKSKYDEAEAKYYQKLARQVKSEVELDIIEKENNVEHSSEFSNTSSVQNKNVEPIKTKIETSVIKARVAEKVPEKTVKKEEVKMANKEVGKSSMEKELNRLEDENVEFKQSLSHLSYFVKKLEDRVRNLESGSISPSVTDEGVDMTGERKCPFFDDCVCNSDSDENKPNLDNISLNDGSEFEEFIATSTSEKCETCEDTLWKDDWEENSGRDLAADLRENCKMTKTQ
eukprot:GFUD01002802.1.p1 GENE.GFUD01002802.1~~GFUD01002802.1.p1  ORF type:complete len:628 (-),score=216.13 GFUD01002802.1:493-2376(-)